MPDTDAAGPDQNRTPSATPPGAGRPSDWRVWLSRRGYPLATLVAFVIYGSLALLNPGGVTSSLSLAVLLGIVALWFIYCVTGDAEAKCYNLFTFAYAFTFGAFALLLVPVLTDQVAPGAHKQDISRTEGALRLVRGCVLITEGASRTLGERLAPCPPASGASGPGQPVGLEATGYRYAWLVSVGGVTARTLAVQSCAAAGAEAAQRADMAASASSLASAASIAASAAGALAAAAEQAIKFRDLAKQAVQASEQARSAADQSCNARGTDDPKRPFVEVIGGVAVPLFVVVLALIGGAVSISRRIPEFQRRNDRNYVPTIDEPSMPAFRVREAVVFQIMQLVSAPFLAIATLQVIEPNNLASASTLAFATGFFSETILYMIRGMVNGLKPELTKVAGAAMVNLTGRVAWEGEPADTGWDQIRIELRPAAGGEWRSVAVKEDGAFVINGLIRGHYQVLATGPTVQPGLALEINVEDKPPAPLEIAVKRA